MLHKRLTLALRAALVDGVVTAIWYRSFRGLVDANPGPFGRRS